MTSPVRANLLSITGWLCFLGPAVLGLLADGWTKALAEQHLSSGHVIEFIPGWLHFQYTTNRGAVFGLGQGQRVLFITVSLLAIVFLTTLFLNSGKQRLYQMVLGMLMAGVLGNMYDRVRFGFVRDMIHGLPGWTWPGTQTEVFPWIFNVADSLLCVGVFLMICYSVLYRGGVAPTDSIDPKVPATNENA